MNESREKTVILEATDCCALRTAFQSHPEIVQGFQERISKDRLRLFEDILQNTSRMSFPLVSEVKMVYGTLAEAEIARLREMPNIYKRFDCGCRAIDHFNALGRLIHFKGFSIPKVCASIS